ncbi:MAG: helix-turn-helix transcriptional regulator [Clostridia bacterium]|nr:helix-turn-helix transcriptional regulator [Clostridia bacterium]
MPKKKITTIKELRAAQKLSQAAFAKTIGVSTASVTAYEAGRVNPSEKVLEKIREVYNVDLSPKPVKKAKAAKPAAEKLKAPKAKRAGKAKAEKSAPAQSEKTEIIIQSPMGGTITPEEIIARIGAADKIYIRVDENKAYWVKGEETGSIDLW